MPERFRLANDKIRFALAQLRYVPRALDLVWRSAPNWTVAWVVVLALRGLLPACTVFLTRGLVDHLVALRGASERIGPVLLYGGMMAAVLLLMELTRSMASLVRTAQSERVSDHITGMIHQKSIETDFAFWESADYYDHLHRARDEARYRPLALLESLGATMQNAVTLVAMAAVLLPYGPWLPPALLLSTLPALFVVLDFATRRHDLWRRTTADERRSEHYDELLSSADAAAELRLFGIGHYFSELYQSLRSRIRSERIRIAIWESLAGVVAGLLALFVTVVAVLWMVHRLILAEITLGGLALFWQAFSQGQGLMRGLLDNAGQIYANTLFLSNLFDFLELPARVTDPAAPLPAPRSIQEGVRLRGVKFHYPGSTVPALKGFDLVLPAGRTTAIVGANGAGKSTLIKLLCRLYDPDEGAIELDGIDIRKYRVCDLRRAVAVLFQQPVRYIGTIADNIAPGEDAPDAERVSAAACLAGAESIVERFPAAFSQRLGKWLPGGTELSGGEWQRIALARAFHRAAPLLLLDEPTSAMDSWAEEEWLRHFRRLAEGRTVVVITHRFTTAMRADVIHVMDQGLIVETGTHTELLALGGRYARSWTAQMNAGSVCASP